MKKQFHDSRKMRELDEKIQNKRQNRFYASYYEDYIAYFIPKENGRGAKIVRIYAGNYHYLDAGEQVFRIRKVIYSLLWLASAGLFVSAAARNLSVYVEKPSVLIQLLVIFAFGWCLIDVMSYALATYHMTEYAFKSFQLLKAAAAITAAAVWADGVFVMATILVQKSGINMDVTASVFEYLLSGGMMFAINRIENKAVYNIFESEDQPPQGAEKIV